VDESLFKVVRDHRGLLRIDFDDSVRPSAIAVFLRNECGAEPVGFLENPLGDFYDVDFRIGRETVRLASDNWMLTLMSTSASSDPTVQGLAEKLRIWEPPVQA
jgi:hypothetical protein